MSEETKSDKQLLLAEHKKANDALMQIKKVMSWEDKNINTLSLALANMFKIIMRSNKNKLQSSLRPIKVRGFKESDMAAKKKVKAVKKPAKKMGKK